MHLAVIVLAILAQSAALDPAGKDKAQALLDQGTTLYEAGDFAGALERFDEAYAAYPSAKLWFNIGQAQRSLGHSVEAIEAFKKFLAGASDAPTESVQAATDTVAELQRQLGRLRITCAATGAEVWLDGMRSGTVPLPEALWVTAGQHEVSVKPLAGGSRVVLVHVAAGGMEDVVVPLEAGSPEQSLKVGPIAGFETRPSSPVVSSIPKQGRTWTWVAGGATVLFAAGAITFGLLMESEYDHLNQTCGSKSATRPGCAQSDFDSVNFRRDAANVLWAATGVAAATTSVLFFVEGHPIQVAPVATGFTGLAARVRY
jgi:hypothetical protein